MRFVVAITGGSCVIYGIVLLKALEQLGVKTHLVVSEMGKYVAKHECNMDIEALKELATYYHENDDLATPIASGLFKTDGMIIAPCSMNTLAAIANGISTNLVTRVANVNIKEGRKMIILPRETAISVIHLENMLKLVRRGVKVVSVAPAFYYQPEIIGDLVNIMVGKVLDQMGIEHNLVRRLGEQ